MFPIIWHRYLFLLGLVCLMAGGMFGSSLLSIGQIAISANWFLEGNYINKIKLLYRNKLFWVLSSLFLWHLFGMVYTDNLHNGLLDLGIKVPLLILPILFFSTKPLTDKELKVVLYSYFFAVTTSAVYCYAVYLGYTKVVVTNFRGASVFMSHIRFSLCIALAVSSMVYYSFKEQNGFIKSLFITSIIWLLFFMYRLEMMTGIVCIAFVGFVFSVYLIFKHVSKNRALFFTLIFGVVFSYLGYHLKKSFSMFDADLSHPQNTLLTETVNKNKYLQDTIYGLAENGNLIGINISDIELQKEWEKRSAISYQSKDEKGNELRYTILHYLASKGFTKDSVGVNNLTHDDVIFIEQGHTNFRYTKGSLNSRWRKLMWEYTKYKRGENPSGHTLTMRLEFWKTANYIIKQNILFGVGTGDIQDSFNKTYTQTNTKLDKRWWLRCHNQYLAITVAFGFAGLLLFLFYLIYPAIFLRKEINILYWCFYIIALVSFITEDTLENQAGVTFFAFFNCLFLSMAWGKNNQDYNSLSK